MTLILIEAHLFLFSFCVVFIFGTVYFYLLFVKLFVHICLELFEALMRKARSLDFLNLDLEIERTLRRLSRERREGNPQMAEQNNQNQNRNDQEQQALRDDFRPIINDNYSGIRRQPINTNNFELKLALINMVQQNQYRGLPQEDLNVHLATFLEIADTVKKNGVTEDVIRMRLFPFS